MADDPAKQAQSGAWSAFRETSPGGEKGRERDVAPRVLIALGALIAAVIFIAQNRNRVETTFLIFDGHPRLWVVILVSLLLGALLGQAGALMLRRRKRADKS
jgi:uncharacterized integral membrane protein